MRLELQQHAITIIKQKSHHNLRFFTKCMFAYGNGRHMCMIRMEKPTK